MSWQMATKLAALVLALATLVTSFSLPAPERKLQLDIAPSAVVLPTPRPVLASEALARTHGPDPNPTYVLRATGYNSVVSQTNAQPFITATGARTGWGILAVSRDLLDRDIPYGSLVRLRDLGGYNGGGAGQYQPLLDQTLFMVEDTLHARKRQQVDIWFEHVAEARQWGVRRVEVEVVRYGREGPVLETTAQAPSITATPVLPRGR